MHCICSFQVQCGCSTMPFDEEESADMVYISYPLVLANLCRLYDLETSPAPSVVIDALTLSGSKSGSRSMK